MKASLTRFAVHRLSSARFDSGFGLTGAELTKQRRSGCELGSGPSLPVMAMVHDLKLTLQQIIAPSKKIIQESRYKYDT